MDQPVNPTTKFSGIPRLSRLPVSREVTHESQKDPVKLNLKSRTLPRIPTREPRRSIIPAQSNNTVTTRTDGNRSTSESIPLSTTEVSNAPTEHTPVRAHTLPRRPRPSLSDRTIETLSQIPPSPSPQRRKSGFFPPESPAKTPSRPGSSLSRSRPGTSQGRHPPMPAGFPTSRPASPIKRPLAPIPSNRIPNAAPERRSTSTHLPKGLSREENTLGNATPSRVRPPLPGNGNVGGIFADTAFKMPRTMRGSQTIAARPAKSRISMQDAFAKPSSTALQDDVLSTRIGSTEAHSISTQTQKIQAAASPRTKKPYQMSGAPMSRLPTESQGSPIPKSSVALRETIAKAKAAIRSKSGNQASSLRGSTSSVDAFPHIDIGGTNDDLLRQRVATARTDGRLNIAALGLTEIPPEVRNMYNSNTGDGAWYESVDLIRLIAADNEFEYLDEKVFPDEPATSGDADDEYQSSLFRGLETLDVHGNRLRSLPTGIQRLERLTNLNVSRNRLTSDNVRIIGQIPCLRELRLADNLLDGEIGLEFRELRSLEILDLSGNNISKLSDSIGQLTHLRMFNIANNALNSLPWEGLMTLSLLELIVARNRLSGTLLPSDVSFVDLKLLDVANNALTSISETSIDLPALQSLDATENRLTALPDLSTCAGLLTLTVGGNKLSAWPKGMTSLKVLKAIDVTRNDIRTLDDSIGFMDSLTVLRVANNPLRERKFLQMDTGELKRELKARCSPEDSATATDIEPTGSVDTNLKTSARSSSIWSVKPGGILDRSDAKLEILENSHLELAAQDAEIKTLRLHYNLLTGIPQAIDLIGNSLKNLDLSHNKITNATLLSVTISLPSLKTLDISWNAVNDLSPLVESLGAPKLAELHVSCNRLISLPNLRDAFPSLTAVSAANNRLNTLEFEAIRGLQILDVSGNEISHLNPKLGLLGSEGLRSLAIGGNTFRVPRRDVLDKGTEAVLTWLRSRIPENET